MNMHNTVSQRDIRAYLFLTTLAVSGLAASLITAPSNHSWI